MHLISISGAYAKTKVVSLKKMSFHLPTGGWGHCVVQCLKKGRKDKNPEYCNLPTPIFLEFVSHKKTDFGKCF